MKTPVRGKKTVTLWDSPILSFLPLFVEENNIKMVKCMKCNGYQETIFVKNHNCELYKEML